MKFQLALTVAKQMCDLSHPSTIKSKQVCPDLVMIRVQNGQYMTTQNTDRWDIKEMWTFEEFVKKFGE